MEAKDYVTKEYELKESQKRYLPVKRAIDVALSGVGIVVLSPVLAGLSLAIKLESPGPVLFKQKRVGKDGKLFEIWKFRSMRTDTPKDMPTHMLSNPDQYITKTGKFIRKTSLDELPQIFNIFCGKMSVIGPRPALWNQEDLIAERDKYGANSVTPGLTGWAQINGRDELEIPVKARFDGEYVEKMGFMMDLKCFLGTIGSVLCHDGVVEGGTGEMKKAAEANEKESAEDSVNDGAEVSAEKLNKEIKMGAAVAVCGIVAGMAALVAVIKFLANSKKRNEVITISKKSNHFLGKLIGILALAEAAATVYANVKRHAKAEEDWVNEETTDSLDASENDFEDEDTTSEKKFTGNPKKILITGAGSYIGTNVEAWLMKEPEQYQVDSLDMTNDAWREKDFAGYDVIYHVAGIAHADVGSVTEEQKQMYYKVNTELACEVAERAKEAGVSQFIFMSSMIVYSGCKEDVITSDIEPNPLNFYGDSKWQADKRIREMETPEFKVVIVRPPMIYGKGSKGNYPQLAKLATKLPVFPIVKNERSMLHIDNLCQFIKLMIDNEESGIFFPQNGEYTNTSDMVEMIAAVKGHRIIMVPGADLPIKLMAKIPGKIGGLAGKAFGSSAYDMSMSEYKENYRINSLKKSIELTEK